MSRFSRFTALLVRRRAQILCILAGVILYFAAVRLQPEETLIAETASYSLHGAYNATRRLVASGTAFTAMFAAADTIAVAAIRALYDAGVRVPQDCSVIAIDGISVTQYTIPALTTMVQPAEELGRGAVTTLIDLIDGRSGNRHITLEAVLREGESVRDVR